MTKSGETDRHGETDSANRSYKIPLVVGVTGHRDIPPEDVRKLKKMFKEVLRELHGLCPETPIVLLSPLAEGADRIAAKAAIELQEKGMELRLVVPRPMEDSTYKMDFTGKTSCDNSTEDSPQKLRERSSEKFDDLLSKAYAKFVLPHPVGIDPKEAKVEDFGASNPARDKLYEQVGAYVAMHSHVVIALWNGDHEDPKPGGTAWVVKTRLKGELATANIEYRWCQRSPLDWPSRGPVIHIGTRRRSSGQLKDIEFLERKWKDPDRGTEERKPGFLTSTWHKIHDKIFPMREGLYLLDEFNSEVEKSMRRDDDTFRENKIALLPDDRMPDHPILYDLRDRFAAADALALLYRNRTYTLLHGIVWTFVISFLCLEIFAHLIPGSWQFLSAYVSGMTIALLFYYLFSIRGRYQSRFEDYRALAEGLRVQFYWRLAGLRRDVADHYLNSNTDVLAWIRRSVRVCNMHDPNSTPAKNADLVRCHWIGRQIKFFTKRSRDQESKPEKLDRLSKAIYNIGLIITAAVVAWILRDPSAWLTGHHRTQSFTIVVITACPMLAAAISYVDHRRAYASQARRYTTTGNIFRRADNALKTALDERTVETIFCDLGNEALDENQGWVRIHRARPIEPIRG